MPRISQSVFRIVGGFCGSLALASLYALILYSWLHALCYLCLSRVR